MNRPILFILSLCLALQAHSGNSNIMEKKRKDISNQEKILDISGEWQSSLGPCRLPGTTDENKLGDGHHDRNVTSQLTRLYPFRGVVSYERTVDIPKEFEKYHLTLELERTKNTTLWIDGELIGSNSNLHAAHTYTLPALKSGKHNIRINVDNRDESVPQGVLGSHAWTDATQTNWNGILGTMKITATPLSYISSLKTYPYIGEKRVEVRMNIHVHKAGQYNITLKAKPNSSPSSGTTAIEYSKSIKLEKGNNDVAMSVNLGDDMKLWSEFHPDTYTLTASISGSGIMHERQTVFGMRQFGVQGTQFTINGHPTFLRGTHDACVFPLTGYCPTDTASWLRLFRIAKQHGINHYRFHSYTPTEAAFIAADMEGIYLHCELPMWGLIDETTTDINELLRHEAFTILEQFGNHPSFMSLGLGNELNGDTAMMARWLDDFRRVDNRHLYNQGSNNDLGWKGPKGGEDFYTTCRVGWGEGFSTHTRTSFSFADADHGGILNWNRPGTRADFSHPVSLCPRPIVSHETCQFQIYPDYTELSKYTGVLYPYNHEIFRTRLEQAGMAQQTSAFHEVTGRWAVECYKADMEYCLRTPGFGGFQLLDIKDYPGQGSALCGILDAFMDSKGIVDAETFRSWNSPVVPLALMDTYCWTTTDTLLVSLALSNYTEDNYVTPVQWELKQNGGEILAKGTTVPSTVRSGEVGHVGTIRMPLNAIRENSQLKLSLRSGANHNSYNLWIYAEEKVTPAIMIADTLDAKVSGALEKGQTVLLCPRLSSIEKQSVGGLFTPDYWNYAMFKTISENNHRPVSPGTLGMMMDARHPALSLFPNEGHTDWQWWSIALNSRPLILDSLNQDFLPIIQTVDNVERNHKLGILMEFRCGKGRILLTTTDLQAISKWPEGRAYANSIISYAQSKNFRPTQELTVSKLEHLLYSETKTRNIQGVKNITDYLNTASH